ncbi:hypothetical protein D9611_002723 [Ephemerocybe angulata]|uniref:Uncharacterized protein n=1 Tax=Ephemerocybe angulata TaxID=980116 RepID=A0A8H5FEI8_9AGAR|nr:hypothetical protein D9611_002723 [Tulosesus angulatus]
MWGPQFPSLHFFPNVADPRPFSTTTERFIEPRKLADIVPLTDVKLQIFLRSAGKIEDVRNTLRRSTTCKPTHLLVVKRMRGGDETFDRPFATIEVNDILFAAHAPNLRPSNDGAMFPRRKRNSLPRVIMEVPYVETFPELMEYFHNNLDTDWLLGRFEIPSWIINAMHPLPSSSIPHCVKPNGQSEAQCEAASEETSPSSDQIEKYLRETSAAIAYHHEARNWRRMIFSWTMRSLIGLRANLLYLGYFDKHLWLHLDLMKEVLARANSLVELKGTKQL